MAQHDEHDDDHHHQGQAHAHDPEAEERMNREVLADREWMFDAFVRWTAWNVVLILAILALLALTQT